MKLNFKSAAIIVFIAVALSLFFIGNNAYASCQTIIEGQVNEGA